MIGAFALWWDATREDTLSNGVDRALENPYTRYLAIGAVALTALHLVNVLPQKADPYHYIAKGLNWTQTHISNT